MNNKLLVIYYHEVVEKGKGFSYQKIEKEKLEAQMQYLHDHGYKTLFFSQLAEKLPDKAVIVSFDDGFRTVFDHAAPILAQYGIRGNVYLPTAYIGQDPRFMTWEMARQLRQTGLWQMQAHTHTHADIRTLDAAALRAQVRDSDALFQQQLGTLPEAFCMPFGTYDAPSVKSLKALGRYRYLLGSHYGRCAENRFHSTVMPRIGISDDDTMETFVKKLEGGLDWKGPLQLLRLGLNNLRKQRITQYDY